MDIVTDLPKLGILFGNYPNLPTVGKLLSDIQTISLLNRANYPTISRKYFILRTGGGEYNDKTGKIYHFKEGIPGYLQLKNGARRSSFVYLKNGQFIGSGEIGEISEKTENGVVNFYANIDSYRTFEQPVVLQTVEATLSKKMTQAGIMEVRIDDYNKILRLSNYSEESPAPKEIKNSPQSTEASFEEIVRTAVGAFKQLVPQSKEKGLHIENDYWLKASHAFHIFWTEKIIGSKLKVELGLEYEDMDPIIRLLDSKGKRSYIGPFPKGAPELIKQLRESGLQYGFDYKIALSPDQGKIKILGVEGVANAMIPQDDWYAMFRELASNQPLKNKLDEIFKEPSDIRRGNLIDELKKLDTKHVLVKPKAVALSAMLSLYNPNKYVQAVSLGQRSKIIEVFGLGHEDKQSFGKQVISSYESISKFNERFGVDLSIIELSYFLYSEEGRPIWQPNSVLTDPEVVKEEELEHIIVQPSIEEIPQIKLNAEMINTGLTLPGEFMEQICSALNCGSHLIITGPVGTGKTTVSEDVCKAAKQNHFCAGYVLTTASSDWTTFDTIGGYMPTQDNRLKFEEGKFLEAIRQNKWLVIDEINRADIDKAFGQLFSVLSGQSVELPFKSSTGKSIVIQTTEENRSYFDETTASYKVGRNWRIMATMNIYDMNFLFEMSYAFMRRFAFIYMGLPENTETLIKNWCKNRNLSELTASRLFALTSLAGRKIGPAITKDMVDYLELRGDGEKELAEAIISYVLPQLEGLDKDKIEVAWEQILFIFNDKSIPNTKILGILQELTGIDLMTSAHFEKA